MEQTIYYVHIDGVQRGPFTLSQLEEIGITSETMVWRSDLPNWVKAHSLPEVLEIINRSYQPPQEELPPVHPPSNPAQEPPYQQPQSQHPYQQQQGVQYPGQQYGQPQQYRYGNVNGMLPPGWTNWQGWAIAGTIVGILTCCLGWIFGLIGVIRAVEANTYARAGMMEEAMASNRNAKTMTLISIIVGGLALLVILIYWVALGAVFSNIINAVGSYEYY